jgi:hypothetical protein
MSASQCTLQSAAYPDKGEKPSESNDKLLPVDPTCRQSNIRTTRPFKGHDASNELATSYHQNIFGQAVRSNLPTAVTRSVTKVTAYERKLHRASRRVLSRQFEPKRKSTTGERRNSTMRSFIICTVYQIILGWTRRAVSIHQIKYTYKNSLIRHRLWDKGVDWRKAKHLLKK